jgi:hypothetical protein
MMIVCHKVNLRMHFFALPSLREGLGAIHKVHLCFLYILTNLVVVKQIKVRLVKHVCRDISPSCISKEGFSVEENRW